MYTLANHGLVFDMRCVVFCSCAGGVSKIAGQLYEPTADPSARRNMARPS